MSINANLEKDYLQEGIAYNKAQLYDLAVVALTKAAEQNPTNPEIFNELGVAYFNQNDFINAEKSFKKSVSLEENSYKSYNNLAWLYVYKQNYKKAEELFLHALAIEPTNPDILTNCGEFYFSVKKLDKALDYFLRTVFIQENGDTYYKIAKCYIEKEQFNDAIIYLLKAVGLNPETADYYRELAKIYYKKNDMEKAKGYFEKLLDLEPKNEWGYSNLGNIYFYHYENFEVANEYYKKAFDLNPDYCWASYNLANVKMIYKDFNSAIELYKTALNLSPQNTLFMLALSQGYYRMGNMDETEKNLALILEIEENNENALFYLAKLYINDKKNYTKARELLEKLKLTNFGISEINYYLAKTDFLEFKKNSAMININKALESNSENDRYKALKLRIEELADDTK